MRSVSIPPISAWNGGGLLWDAMGLAFHLTLLGYSAQTEIKFRYAIFRALFITLIVSGFFFHIY